MRASTSINHCANKNNPAVYAMLPHGADVSWWQHLRPYPELIAAQESEKCRLQLSHGCSRRHLERELGIQSIVSAIFDYLDLSDLCLL